MRSYKHNKIRKKEEDKFILILFLCLVFQISPSFQVCEHLYNAVCQPYIQNFTEKLNFQPSISKKSEFQHKINMELADSLEFMKDHPDPDKIYAELEIDEDERHIFHKIMKEPIRFYTTCMSNLENEDDSYLKVFKITEPVSNGQNSVLDYLMHLYSKMPELIGSENGGTGL